MAFKVSNETKVGALTGIAITILILGYSYMSGKDNLFGNELTVYANFKNAGGLAPSAAVLLNGYKIGRVDQIKMDTKTHFFSVKVDISEPVKVPKNSVLKITNADFFGTKQIELVMGDATEYCKDGDFLDNATDPSLVETLGKVMKPMQEKAQTIMNSLDSVLKASGLHQTIAGLPATMNELKTTIHKFGELVEITNPRVADVLNQLQSLSATLSANKDKIASAISNFDKVSQEAASLKLKETLDNVNSTITNLNGVITKINSGEGTLGQLATNKALYDNLDKTAKDLDALVADIRLYPKKYVPLPWSKRQRRKAIEQSSNDPRVNPK